MAEMSLIRALGALKLIKTRVEAKKQAVVRHMYRPANTVDPLEKSGGSEKHIAENEQAIRDLQLHLVAIRRGIAQANLQHRLTLPTDVVAKKGGFEQLDMLVSDWLVWKREVAEKDLQFLRMKRDSITRIRQTEVKRRAEAQIARRGGMETEPLAVTDVIVHLDEKELDNKIEWVEVVLRELDTEFADFNAKHTIEVPDNLEG